MFLAVNTMSLRTILEAIQQELTEREKIREEVHKNMRKATRLSKQAIQVTHQERFDDAKTMLNEATQVFEELKQTATSYPYVMCMGSVEAAYEENAEAHILVGLVTQNRFVTPQEIDVPITPYILSLGDVIGELRRRALDLIRKGNIAESEKCLEWMEFIYSELTALDDAYVIVSGLRRKGDVARKLIEITRGDLTIEVRRTALETAISKLENKLEKE